jgi:hypothetical protein
LRRWRETRPLACAVLLGLGGGLAGVGAFTFVKLAVVSLTLMSLSSGQPV